ncbi:putative cytochrome oxidase biogenesis protein 1-1 (OXA1) [Babesia divergens]|uniref:Cytochrome oxidase biogenesis protein 1-1 (OXA1) n=1 Tax=Babesia divergens TaxID=32595 RepID=A0AAD9LGE2_BABDI|nr:putative cytochrome oxidase biogenesis protein 1-1 (OXA1) [Babesia divergens]
MYIREFSRVYNRTIADPRYLARWDTVVPVFSPCSSGRSTLYEGYGRRRTLSTSNYTCAGNSPTQGRIHTLESLVNHQEGTSEPSVIYTSAEEHLLARIAEHNGNTKGLLQRLLPVEAMRDTLIAIHDVTGLSWAATITACTLFLKVCFIPVWALGERARRNNAHLVPIAVELQEKLKQAQKTGDVKLAVQIQRKLYRQMTRKTFIKGAALQLGAASIQGITFAWVYGGLKMFAIEPTYCAGFALEKVIWLDSLALPDPYYAFPATLGVLMTTVYELNQRTAEQMRLSSGAFSTAMQEQEIRQQKMKYFTRAAIFVFAYFSATMTSGTFFYLIPSFLFQTILRYVTRRGFVANILRLPTPTELPVAKTESITFQKVKTF